MTDNRTTELRVKRLRELLDERGIEHYDHENGEPLRVLEKAEEPATSWRVDGASYCAVPDGKGTFDVWIDHCTPEQAIAATLGSERETCHAESDLSEWVCSNCQCWIPLGLTPENIKHASEWRYCPHCRAKVVSE